LEGYFITHEDFIFGYEKIQDKSPMIIYFLFEIEFKRIDDYKHKGLYGIEISREFTHDVKLFTDDMKILEKWEKHLEHFKKVEIFNRYDCKMKTDNLIGVG